MLAAAFQVVLALVIGFSMFSEHLLLEVDCLIYISTANTREKIITVLVRKVVSILPAPCCSHLDTETFFSVCSPDSESRRADKIFFPLCQHYRWNQDAFWTSVGQVSPLLWLYSCQIPKPAPGLVGILHRSLIVMLIFYRSQSPIDCLSREAFQTLTILSSQVTKIPLWADEHPPASFQSTILLIAQEPDL